MIAEDDRREEILDPAERRLHCVEAVSHLCRVTRA